MKQKYNNFLRNSRPRGIWTPTYHQTTNQQSGVLTITPQRQLWVGDTENLAVAFSHAWLVRVQLNSSNSANLLQNRKNTNVFVASVITKNTSLEYINTMENKNYLLKAEPQLTCVKQQSAQKKLFDSDSLVQNKNIRVHLWVWL